MIREEAIYWLDHSDLSRVKFYEAVGYAIRALKDDVPDKNFGKWIKCSDCERRCKKWENLKI